MSDTSNQDDNVCESSARTHIKSNLYNGWLLEKSAAMRSQQDMLSPGQISGNQDQCFHKTRLQHQYFKLDVIQNYSLRRDRPCP